jgi:predicted GNAT family N-acyltransferase
LKNINIFTLPWDQAREKAYAIRKQVFVDEQNVPEDLEIDELDSDASHILVFEGDQCIGTARLVDLGNHQAQIGRMAVLDDFRGQGIGRKILDTLIQQAGTQGAHQVLLHAQIRAIPFYEKCGFIAQGPQYQEAGIDHRNMMLILPNHK